MAASVVVRRGFVVLVARRRSAVVSPRTGGSTPAAPPRRLHVLLRQQPPEGRSFDVGAAAALGRGSKLRSRRRTLSTNSTSSHNIDDSTPPAAASPEGRSGSNTNPTATNIPLSSAGKLFFGSLCAGTFALGCWQTKRLFEKQQLVTERTQELQSEPATALTSDGGEGEMAIRPGSFRRLELRGRFDHHREVLVGPRGGPLGSTSSNTGGYGGNMPSPQGYYVVTPFITTDGTVVLVNRGWVPRTLVVPSHSHQQQHRRGGGGGGGDIDPPRLLEWSRPAGMTTIRAVPAALEKPRFLVANHNYKARPIQFYWFDVETMKSLVQRDDVVLLTSYATEEDVNEVKHNKTSTSPLYEPLKPTLESLQEFKISPPVHAAYAFTWFSLSLAGLVMTRRLALAGASGGGVAKAAAKAAAAHVRP